MAEDNPINQKVILMQLAKVGCISTLASDGLQAIEIAQRSTFDLVILDYQMPGIDGPEVARRLRAMPSWSRIPLVALTANARPEDRETCLSAGMNGFLAKPVTLAELTDVMIQCLQLVPGAGPTAG